MRRRFATAGSAPGDLGHVDAEGFLYITGRASDMYISGGSNVYPREIEEKLLTHPAIAEVAILGVPDRTWGEVGVAVCVTRDGAQVTEQDLLAVHGRQGFALQTSATRLLLGSAAEIRLRQDHQAGGARRARSARMSAAGKRRHEDIRLTRSSQAKGRPFMSEQQTILVTGGASGIGLAIVEAVLR